MNVELTSDIVQPWLRPDLGGIMVLPVSINEFPLVNGSIITRNVNTDQLAFYVNP